MDCELCKKSCRLLILMQSTACAVDIDQVGANSVDQTITSALADFPAVSFAFVSRLITRNTYLQIQ